MNGPHPRNEAVCGAMATAQRETVLPQSCGPHGPRRAPQRTEVCPQETSYFPGPASCLLLQLATLQTARPDLGVKGRFDPNSAVNHASSRKPPRLIAMCRLVATSCCWARISTVCYVVARFSSMMARSALFEGSFGPNTTIQPERTQ